MPFLIVGIMIVIITVIIVVAICAIISKQTSKHNTPYIFEPPEKIAGRRGERIATNAIGQVLREDDYLFTNVSAISSDGKRAEMDNVVVNKYGVFIIEVKNYKGRLYGNEEDFEWKKYKDDGYGNTFVATVKNPIKQVKRQVYILAVFLRCYGADVWVKGYALLVQGNCPVESDYVLTSLADIDRAIHTFDRKIYDARTIERVKGLLK